MGTRECVQESAHEGKKVTLLNPVLWKVKPCVAPKYKERNSWKESTLVELRKLSITAGT